ncbi:hypothetical protein MAH1_00790 [Sessilibacter sp. MAH1]
MDNALPDVYELLDTTHRQGFKEIKTWNLDNKHKSLEGLYPSKFIWMNIWSRFVSR